MRTLYQPEGGEQHDHRRPAIGDQRQGDADDRHQPGHHRHVDHEEQEERSRDPVGQERGVSVAVRQPGEDAEPDDQCVKHQQGKGPDEAEFLGQRGEDEVGVLFGQEVQPRLCALHIALARPAAGAQRDLRLGDVIARAKRIGAGIEEGVDPPELIILDQLPVGATAFEDGENQRDDQRKDGTEIPKADPGGEHHDPAPGEQQDRGAKVGLLQHQEGRHKNDDQRHQHPERARDLFHVQPVVIGREEHDERDLHHLGRLQAHRPEIQPALRALAHIAEKLHRDQQQKRAEIDHGGNVAPEPDRDKADDEHRHHPQDEALHLRFGPDLDPPARDGIKHEEAKAGDGGQQQGQWPVDEQHLAQARGDGLDVVLKITHARLCPLPSGGGSCISCNSLRSDSMRLRWLSG